MPSAQPDPSPALLVPGRTCWRLCEAPRAALLVDGAAYFEAFVAAVRRARRSVRIAGWDMDSRVALLRPEGAAGDGARPDEGHRLGRFLDEVAAARPELEVHLLAWDFPLLYALEREALPIFHLGWRTHPRVHFHLDGEHPLGASHHQKLVVVDDQVAFCGGLDLTQRRWDRPAHDPREPARRDPKGEPYEPFHDLQLLVDGEAAAALGELLRERWRRATGETLPAAPPTDHDPWPPEVSPLLEHARVGIARTEPAYLGRPEVREVERLHLAAIAGAREHLYVENQYLTAQVIEEALAARLEEADGPEVVLVINLNSTGWLEEATMDAMRGRIVRRLQAADRHGRLRILCPVVPDGAAEVDVKVHAKALVVDDRLLCVGSANLNNRSMGLDSECCLAIEADGDAARLAVRRARDGLLAEHLGTTPETVAAALRERGSLIGAIERLNHGPRGLRPLAEKAGTQRPLLEPEPTLVDPEQPVALERLVDDLLHEQVRARPSVRWAWLLRGGLLIALAVAGVLAWRFTPLGDTLDREALIAWGHAVRTSALAPLYVLGAYLLGGLTLFPITVLIGATAAVFDLLPSMGYALAGSLLSALLTYAVGQGLGRDLVRRLGGTRLNRLSRRLARRGLVAVLVVRVLPLAPFTVINLVAGATHIRLRDFVLGTVLGMAPGIVGTSLVVNQAMHLMLAPSLTNAALLGALAVATVLAGRWLARRARRDGGPAPEAEGEAS